MTEPFSAAQDFTRACQGLSCGTVLADPPWQFANRTGKMAPEQKRLNRYATLKLNRNGRDRWAPLLLHVGEFLPQDFERRLAFVALDRHVHSHFARADRLDVDPGAGQRGKYANSDAGMTPHSDARDRELSNRWATPHGATSQLAPTVGRFVGTNDGLAQFPNAGDLGTTHCVMASVHTDAPTASV